MNKSKRVVVGISVGDINGVGVEIILKTFSDKRILDFCTPVLFASNKTISLHKKILNIDTPINKTSSLDQLNPNKINLLNVWNEDVQVEIGEATPTGGNYALKSLEAAVQALDNKKIDLLVTAPINKNTIQSDSFTFPGHTEYLESKLEGEALMILMAGNLKVALLTGHIPIQDVSKTITSELIHKKVNLLYRSLQQDFSIAKPKIAVLSINPHAGDNGVIGNEDKTIVIPAIDDLQKKGMQIYGPYPSDSFFGSENYKNFDAILAAYHDQGLTAFKTLSFGMGVNFTAGLNRVRTSPDHGTAFDISGKNEADASSFKEALFTGISIFNNRAQNNNLEKNALK
jgi:4-hydroxythreonine-4-phosphate dehydrogenase